MIKKCISLWIVICLLVAAASHNEGHESSSGETGQPTHFMAAN